MTVRALLASTDARELACWQVLAEVDPYGERRADWRAALVASNAAFASGLLKESPPMADFLLEFEDPAGADDAAEAVAAKVRSFFFGKMRDQRAGR